MPETTNRKPTKNGCPPWPAHEVVSITELEIGDIVEVENTLYRVSCIRSYFPPYSITETQLLIELTDPDDITKPLLLSGWNLENDKEKITTFTRWGNEP